MMKGKNLINRIIAGIIATVLSAGMTACSGSGTDDSLQKVLDSGELVLGMDYKYPPMGFENEDGEVVGFDIDVATEVCNRLGIKLVTKDINWDLKEKDLKSGKIDCIWNGMSYSEERAASMTLSEPYMKNDVIYAVSKDSDIKYINDLKGKYVGIQAGSSAEMLITESEIYSSITIVQDDDKIILMKQVESGDIDAVILDSVLAYYYISENDMNLAILSAVIETEDYVIGFRKGDNELCDKIEEILHEMKDDGTLAEISKKWFGTDVTTLE